MVFLSMLIYYIEATLYLIRNGNLFDRIIVFDKFQGLVPLIVARILGIASVYMEYNIWPWSYDQTERSLIFSIQVFFGRLITRIANKVTGNSPDILRGMIRLGIPKRIDLVPTGIDAENLMASSARNIPSQNFLVLYSGRLVMERGADMLPEIIHKVTESSPSYRFIIAGGGLLLKTIESKIKLKNLHDFVEILGQVNHSQVLLLMQQVHVTLFISPQENYGSLALLECLAHGCPVIATNVGSTSELIRDRYNGFLTPATSDHIAQALLDLEFRKEKLSEMSSNCTATAKEFSWEMIANRFDNVMERE